MRQEITFSNQKITTLARKSWTAYILLIVAGIFAIFFGIGILNWSYPAGIIVLVIALALVIYKFLLIQSYHLYLDDTSVWLFRGIFPWNKGSFGVKWRDISEAVYYPNIFSWLFNSYEIRVGHRFTNSSEIRLTSMRNGMKAVATINAKLFELAKNNQLQ